MASSACELGDPELASAEGLGHAGCLAGRQRHLEAGVVQRRGDPRLLQRGEPGGEVGHPDAEGRLVAALEDVVDGPRGHAPTPGEDGDPVAGVLDLGEEVAGHEHRPSLVAERAQELADLLDARRIEAVGGLVQDQELGILEQRLGQPEPLAHPERVGLHEVVGPLGQPHPVERPLHRLGPDAIDPSEEGEVAPAAHGGEQAGRAERGLARGRRGPGRGRGHESAFARGSSRWSSGPPGARSPSRSTRSSPRSSKEDLAKQYPTYLTVNRSTFELTLWKDLEPAKTYTVAIGAEGFDTPAGVYNIQNKAVDPAWSVPRPTGPDPGGTVVPGAPRTTR